MTSKVAIFKRYYESTKVFFFKKKEYELPTKGKKYESLAEQSSEDGREKVKTLKTTNKMQVEM